MSSDAVTRVSVEIAGSEISFETGRMAKQASGAVVVQQGDTMVLCTAVAGGVRDTDFLPLTVDVEERMYSAGKIPGSFFKREGRAGEKGTLTARMIDRPIRPLFPKDWRFDTQLVAIPISIDHVHPYDILAMNGASAALMISDIPLPTPVGAVRIGKIEGNFVVNPREDDLLADAETPSELDLIVAGTEDAILMVEAGANEIPEAEILDALDIAHAEIKKLCALQRELAEKVGKAKKEFVPIQADPELLEKVRGSHGATLDAATQVEDKLERQDATKAVEAEVLARVRPAAPEGASEDQLLAAKERRQAAQLVFDKLEKRSSASASPSRRSARTAASENEIRDISIEVGVMPRAHGSALFTRGQTQALSVVAMGTLKEEMRLDTLGLETKKYYWHHYNFPPFSVGEAGRMGGVKRRDIGHGALAERALRADDPVDRGVPVHDPRGVRHPRVQRLLLDGVGLRLLAVADGRGRADQAPGRGDRDGPDQGGRRLHRPDRHRRRRGPPRRHGLQGRRHRSRHHRPADGHQDLGRHLRHPARRARPGEGGAHVHPRQDGTTRSRAPREQLSQFAPRIETIQIDPSPDRAADRQGRRNDPRPVPTSSNRRSTSTTTARC